MKVNNDTITAIATPAGRGGVGIVRVSGPLVTKIAEHLLGKLPSPRYAYYAKFLNADQTIIDEGIALYFIAPSSFTGEDVLELHGHGGPVVINMLLARVVELGARLARPGEFSERAFLNDKLDLAQAEAIADLIDAQSAQAVRNAVNTLQGEFSDRIHELVQQLIHLRVYVEAALDFPEEEIDFISEGKVAEQLQAILGKLQAVLQSAKQGAILCEGLQVVIAGKPNAGKSSLLNRLTGRESAIVTDIAGTTRDVLREHIQIDGIPLHVIDTAGLRHSDDIVEQEGIKRARREIEKADLILLVIDASDENVEASLTLPEQAGIKAEYAELFKLNVPIILVKNKMDLINVKSALPCLTKTDTLLCKKGEKGDFSSTDGPRLTIHDPVSLSAKTGQGIDQLKQVIKHAIGYQELSEGNFTARQRHLDALSRAQQLLWSGQAQLAEHKAGELLAEDLLQAQNALNEITGEFGSDDLLGEIFSNFCIGK